MFLYDYGTNQNVYNCVKSEGKSQETEPTGTELNLNSLNAEGLNLHCCQKIQNKK